MPDDILTVKDPQGNTLETWESTFGIDELPVPLGKRKAALWKKMPAAFYNWLQNMTILRLNRHDSVFRQSVLWTDIHAEDILYVPEVAGIERPPQDGIIRGQSGKILRKEPIVVEPVYFCARAKYSPGAVRLWLTAEGNTSGNAVLAVGLAESLDGPWMYYYGSSPWTFDPTQPIQVYDIAITDLEVGKLYYYRVVRPKEAPGDTLNASVLLAKVQVR
jgi:hypothetical protein